MIGKRYVDGDKLIGSIEQAEVGVRSRITSWLKRQPKAPKLIGRQRAAEILGVGSPYISQLIRNGDMPEAIKVAGGKDAYDEAEVKALAAKRARQRREKEKN